MKVRCQGFQWSESFPVPEEGAEAKGLKEVLLKDQRGNQCSVMLSVEKQKGAKTKLTFYAEALIINETGESLHYYIIDDLVKKTKERELAGQNPVAKD